MTFFSWALLLLFCATTVMTAVGTAMDYGKKGGIAHMLIGVCVVVFGVLVAFAIPAQILLDVIGDRTADI